MRADFADLTPPRLIISLCRIAARGGLALALIFASPFHASAADSESASSVAATDDLEAQERQLRAQRDEIDRKLAALAERRKQQSGGSTQPTEASPSGKSAKPAAPEGKSLTTPQAATPQAEPLQTTENPTWFSAHGQATVITQKHDAFHAPYTGPLSLQRVEPIRTSATGTLFLGVRLPWPGGEFYVDPEFAGGEGFSGTTGIAGFPNGEIPRVGTPAPEPYVARLFYRQTFDLGGEKHKLEDGPNQLAGEQAESRFVLTVGKFAAVDIFQQSAYANDPRGQFFNWGLYTAGAWDYPADTRGYTEGVVLELDVPDWSLRYGAMLEPKSANGGSFDSRILNALANSLELERRWTLDSHVGSAKLMGFINRSDAGSYRQAINLAAPGVRPELVGTRTFRSKYGFSLTVDQELTDDVGAFTRLAWNDGHSETWAFTEIDRSAALGIAIKGKRWGRPDDVIGLAGTLNGLAKDHRDYLGAGGLGFIVGDGRLPHYALEQIIETYYDAKLADHLFLTPDFQFVNHPAYNSDRGPVYIGGIRVHAEF